MRRIRSVSNSTAWQAILSIGLSLCVLFVLLPEVKALADDAAYSSSTSLNLSNYALPVSVPLVDNLNRTKRSDTGFFRKQLSAPERSSVAWVWRHFSPHNFIIFSYAFSFDIILRGGLQQASRLLDIPPPGLTVSS